ncbi:MAG: ATP-binding protein [Candidatus Sumerlaeia bacterium]
MDIHRANSGFLQDDLNETIDDSSEGCFASMDLMMDVLNISAGMSNEHEAVRNILERIHDMLSCDAVGLRLEQDGDCPYYETRGMSAEFLDKERSLCGFASGTGKCPEKWECLCGHVLRGDLDLSLPFMTDYGSLWENDTARRAADGSFSGLDGILRGTCIREGYQSICLIPLKFQEHTIGLLQISSFQKHFFRSRQVRNLERIASAIALGLHHSREQEHKFHLDKRMEALVGAVPDIICEVDSDKRMIWLNEAGLAFYGPDAIGRHVSDFFENENDTYSEVEPLFQGQQDVVYVESWQRRIDGEKRLLAWQCRVLKDRNGKVIGAISAGRDITSQKRAQLELIEHRDHLDQMVMERTEELVRTNRKLQKEIQERIQVEEALRSSEKATELARQEAEKANEAKTRFLANMSHELRTPLNGILGFTDILADSNEHPLNDKQKEYFDKIRFSSRHLLNLINDLLDLAKADANRIEVHCESIGPAELFEDITTLVQVQAQAKNIDFVVDSGLDSRALIWADRRLLTQILLNLLSNAMKFTPAQGRVELTCNITSEKWAMISVRDNGMGIAAEDQKNLFSEFYQVEQVRDSELGGTGLGLALTKRLVELHGGKICVESSPGKGSVFSFSIPRSTAKPPTFWEKHTVKHRQEPEVQRLEGCRILVAEDNIINQELILAILENWGVQVEIAENGEEAIEKVQLFQPQIVLMDLRMPRMDGLTATREIRKNPDFSKLPILALTASADSQTRKQCTEAGCDSHLSKPLEPQKVLEELLRYVE